MTSTIRTNKSVYLRLNNDNTFSVSYFPNGATTAVTDEAILSGIKCTLQNNNDVGFSASIYVSYLSLNTITSSSVNYNSTIGITAGEFNSSGNFYGWSYNGTYIEPSNPTTYVKLNKYTIL